jgi:hypothetical protein
MSAIWKDCLNCLLILVGMTGLEAERLFAGDAPAEGIGDEALNSPPQHSSIPARISPILRVLSLDPGKSIGMLANSQRVVCIRMLRHGDPHHQPWLGEAKAPANQNGIEPGMAM